MAVHLSVHVPTKIFKKYSINKKQKHSVAVHLSIFVPTKIFKKYSINKKTKWKQCGCAFVYLCPHFPNECGREILEQDMLHLLQLVQIIQTYIPWYEIDLSSEMFLHRKFVPGNTTKSIFWLVLSSANWITLCKWSWLTLVTGIVYFARPARNLKKGLCCCGSY